MEQAQAFLEECEALALVIGDLDVGKWQEPTQFKGWTINDVIVHLHFWNRAADLALRDETAFATLLQSLFAAIQAGGLRNHENAEISQRGPELFNVWQAFYRDMAARWASVDPKKRLKWAGPDMSARSSMTARQMETWAHGFEVFDHVGANRIETDRIQNVVVMGVNTFGWSFKVRGKEPDGAMPTLRLTSPSGAIWQYGDGDDLIEGEAVDFASVVTQTRNIADTTLKVTGPVAREWMEHAQCFAGPPENPPPKGTRFAAKR